MKTGEKVLIVVLAIIGIICVVAAGRSQHGERRRALGIGANVGLSLDDDSAQHWLCQPSQLHHIIDWHHPLYRRPTAERCSRTRLLENGWNDWMLDPPSEVGG